MNKICPFSHPRYTNALKKKDSRLLECVSLSTYGSNEISLAIYKMYGDITCIPFRHLSLLFVTIGIDPLIIFSNSYYVRSLSLDGREYNLIADDFQGAVALDFDYKESRLFVLDVFRAHIVRMWMNGTDREVIIEDFVNGGEGMSVDWVGRYVDDIQTCGVAYGSGR